jgi:hypothetical protein
VLWPLAIGMPAAGASAQGLADLWRLRGGSAGQASSCDPRGGNDDHGHFAAVAQDGTRTLVRLHGRGRITRLWSADPKGILRLVDLQGERTLYEGPFAALFDGTRPPFGPPLSRYAGGGFACYVPVAFEGGLVATLRPAAPGGDVDCYWQLGWHLDGQLDGQPDGPDVHRGAAPTGGDLTRGFTLAPGYKHVERPGLCLHRSALLCELEGPGIIRELRFRLPGVGAELLRRVRVEVAFDEAQPPAVLAPIGDFLGLAFDGVPVQTQAQGSAGPACFGCRCRSPAAPGWRSYTRIRAPGHSVATSVRPGSHWPRCLPT